MTAAKTVDITHGNGYQSVCDDFAQKVRRSKDERVCENQCRFQKRKRLLWSDRHSSSCSPTILEDMDGRKWHLTDTCVGGTKSKQVKFHFQSLLPLDSLILLKYFIWS